MRRYIGFHYFKLKFYRLYSFHTLLLSSLAYLKYIPRFCRNITDTVELEHKISSWIYVRRGSDDVYVKEKKYKWKLPLVFQTIFYLTNTHTVFELKKTEWKESWSWRAYVGVGFNNKRQKKDLPEFCVISLLYL